MKDKKIFDEFYYFSTPVYKIHVPEFLSSVIPVAEEYVNISKKECEFNEIYPSYMSPSFVLDERITAFTNYVIQSAWYILDNQGYNVNNLSTYFESMWLQEHYKHSLMEQHTHGNGNQLVGFYFLETPDNCSRVLFHDPRPAKVQINLPEKDISEATLASQMINFKPEPGDLFFTNAWLNHSFTRHASEKPLKFVHFNIYVGPVQQTVSESEAEIV